MAARRITRQPNCLLEKAAGRDLSAEVANRSASTVSSDSPRRKTLVDFIGGIVGSAEGVEPPRGNYLVHDPLGCLSDVTLPLHWARGHPRGVPNCWSNSP